ncbi:hypothetical protein P3T76_010796 [Phytophthora citrophthora]|uniref:Tc1-like transposase DDE domain-containing protein n=1 Tax=Phytophthora citrophthora TaxID=4793 RepID=A0AAD9LFZ7_9STRA|nr:hypothetical protein P3T76_010796 [Phytophthora citrophthora]
MPVHVEHIMVLWEDNCLLGLDDLVDELQITFDVVVAPQTIHGALDAMCYTLKKIHSQPSETNSPRVKALRRQYVQYIIQTTYRLGTSDANAITTFVRELLDMLMDEGVSLFNVIIVCDNASIHTGVKEVAQLSDYVNVELKKLAPYSPMLNPIENVFSVFKSEVKWYLAADQTS